MCSTTVIIIGGIHHNTLGVLRSLGDSQIKKENIILLLTSVSSNKGDFVSKSKYVKKSNVHYFKNDVEIVNWLINNGSISEKKVIICCSDGSAEQIFKHKNELKQFYFTPSMRMNEAELLDKDAQSRLAESVGLNVPYGIRLNKSLYANISWDRYPCIVKPLKSVLGAGKEDISIAYNQLELEETLRNIKADEIQIQEYIEKSMEYQLIGCSLNAGDIIIIPGFTDIIRQPKNTNTGYLKYSSIELLDVKMECVHKLIRTIGYSGLFSMEFIRDTYGIDYYLETNFRNDGNGYCVTTAGVNLPYLWCFYNIYTTLPQNENTGINRSVYFIPDLEDLKIGIRTEGLFKWFKEFVSAKSHAVFSVVDPIPGIYQVLSRIWEHIIKHKS